MDNTVSNLGTASTYINNLLLARGLLRNGTPIDFASLATALGEGNACTSAEGKKSAGDRATVTAQTMNLVHDLLLRRDKDQERLEQVAQTLRTLRTDATQSHVELERLLAHNATLEGRLVSAQSATRSAQKALNNMESSARQLREEVARAKTTVQQLRTQCTNDVRKRDVQIQRLKAHLSSQQRGTGKTAHTAPVAPSCEVVVGETRRNDTIIPSIQDANYSLNQETTDFLTTLSASLSEENDALMGLVRRTLATLRELQGMPVVQRYRYQQRQIHTSQSSIHSKSSLILGISSEKLDEDGLVHIPPTYDSLSKDVADVLESLRDLLTNPSFAPIEEVHTRDEEIQRLREGWEKMEFRWKEAVHLMHGWRRRMLTGGNTVGLDELRIGLKLGEGLESECLSAVTPSSLAPPSPTGDDAFLEDIVEVEDLPQPESPFHANEPDVLLQSPQSLLVSSNNESKALQPATGNAMRSPKRVVKLAPIVENYEKEAKENFMGHEGLGLQLPAIRTSREHSKVDMDGIEEDNEDNEERQMTVSEKLAFAAAEARRVSAGTEAGVTLARADTPDLDLGLEDDDAEENDYDELDVNVEMEKPVCRIPLDESTSYSSATSGSDMASNNRTTLVTSLDKGIKERDIQTTATRTATESTTPPSTSTNTGSKPKSEVVSSKIRVENNISSTTGTTRDTSRAKVRGGAPANGRANLTRRTVSSAAKVAPISSANHPIQPRLAVPRGPIIAAAAASKKVAAPNMTKIAPPSTKATAASELTTVHSTSAMPRVVINSVPSELTVAAHDDVTQSTAQVGNDVEDRERAVAAPIAVKVGAGERGREVVTERKEGGTAVSKNTKRKRDGLAVEKKLVAATSSAAIAGGRTKNTNKKKGSSSSGVSSKRRRSTLSPDELDALMGLK